MTDVLEVVVQIAAPPATVYGFFTDPERYVAWMGTTATLDPRAGGIYRIRMRDGVETSGKFLELDPPHRLTFTWGWTQDGDVPPGSTRVEVTFTEHEGGTRVVLRHHDLPSEPQREHHGAGWRTYLDRLEVAVGGRDPGPDPNG
jgi:uncharacterized protein YndB with AHSA1/START domain